MLPHDLALGCACFAASDLPRLAGLRTEASLRVLLNGERVWVAWQGDGADVLKHVLPLPGAEVYEHRGGLWFRRGNRLPSFDLPIDRQEGLPLSAALVPLPVSPVEPNAEAVQPVSLRLVRDETPRATTALRCALDGLAAWAERATSSQLGAFRAAYADDEVLLTGRRLPPVSDGRRYWGEDVWIPLGFRPEPALRESALRNSLGIASGEVLILRDDGFEVVSYDAFRPLTRAGVRLACERRGRTA